jgi:hypothetical protein
VESRLFVASPKVLRKFFQSFVTLDLFSVVEIPVKESSHALLSATQRIANGS